LHGYRDHFSVTIIKTLCNAFCQAYLEYRDKASFSETMRFEAEKLLKTVRFKMLRNALKRLVTLGHGVEKVF
jgi:hypothetical protein